MTEGNPTDEIYLPQKHSLNTVRGMLCWMSLGVLGTLALMLMLVTPSLRWRQRIGRMTARSVLRAGGVRLTVHGAELLPAGACVVVANHVSYLDGLVLCAALPARFSFVIKKEMESVPMAGLLLRLIGSEFVDRFNRHRGAMDARRVLRRASQGQSLIFFPEGTFSRQPGLLRFHTGAFAAAVRAGCPVVPVVVRGARNVLPPGRRIPTPGAIDVEILEPLMTLSDEPETAVHLRDRARTAILNELKEPDLGLL